MWSHDNPDLWESNIVKVLGEECPELQHLEFSFSRLPEDSDLSVVVWDFLCLGEDQIQQWGFFVCSFHLYSYPNPPNKTMRQSRTMIKQLQVESFDEILKKLFFIGISKPVSLEGSNSSFLLLLHTDSGFPVSFQNSQGNVVPHSSLVWERKALIPPSHGILEGLWFVMDRLEFCERWWISGSKSGPGKLGGSSVCCRNSSAENEQAPVSQDRAAGSLKGHSFPSVLHAKNHPAVFFFLPAPPHTGN